MVDLEVSAVVNEVLAGPAFEHHVERFIHDVARLIERLGAELVPLEGRDAAADAELQTAMT